MARRLPSSPLFPYTTLFRSRCRWSWQIEQSLLCRGPSVEESLPSDGPTELTVADSTATRLGAASPWWCTTPNVALKISEESSRHDSACARGTRLTFIAGRFFILTT